MTSHREDKVQRLLQSHLRGGDLVWGHQESDSWREANPGIQIDFGDMKKLLVSSLEGLWGEQGLEAC